MSQTDGGLAGDANNGALTSITGLLQDWAKGDRAAAERLLPVVYGELRRRAAAQLLRERRNHTLQPTALVHEVFLRLNGQRRAGWQNRTQFFATASHLMRRILVDHARRRLAAKRDAECTTRAAVGANLDAVAPHASCLLRLDDALNDLARLDGRQAQIVELCYFGGFTENEIAQMLAISRSTVARELRSARAFLHRHLTVA